MRFYHLFSGDSRTRRGSCPFIRPEDGRSTWPSLAACRSGGHRLVLHTVCDRANTVLRNGCRRFHLRRENECVGSTGKWYTSPTMTTCPAAGLMTSSELVTSAPGGRISVIIGRETWMRSIQLGASFSRDVLIFVACQWAAAGVDVYFLCISSTDHHRELLEMFYSHPFPCIDSHFFPIRILLP